MVLRTFHWFMEFNLNKWALWLNINRLKIWIQIFKNFSQFIFEALNFSWLIIWLLFQTLMGETRKLDSNYYKKAKSKYKRITSHQTWVSKARPLPIYCMQYGAVFNIMVWLLLKEVSSMNLYFVLLYIFSS